ncbi:MAG: hypothetical protein HFH45_00715 [Bacilli bacterium]|nr:hypothetical protein [Bacilli bacterium]
MKSIQEETQELISVLPEVNSVTAYGSGYFEQDSMIDEEKSMDLIISVDNPSLWHAKNLLQNPSMYREAGWKNLIDIAEIEKQSHSASFPESLGCFFATFGNHEYKLMVVDKRLLYGDLKNWSCFSLAGRFQKPTTLIVDNSDGVLPALMRLNYKSAARAALLMHESDSLNSQELLETIVSLSYLGDFRRLVHCEDPNKIPNILEGSYDFFEQTYLSLPEFYVDWCEGEKGPEGLVYRKSQDEEALKQQIDELPSCLRNYLYNVIPKELNDRKKVAQTIRRFFKEIDLHSSIELASRCRETVGMRKTGQTIIGKVKKGMQKVKSR